MAVEIEPKELIELPGGMTIPRTSVYMLNVNPGDVSAPFSDSLMQLSRADRECEWNVFEGKLGWVAGTNISNPRNECVKAFLKTDAEWAWFCDSDMVFGPDVLMRMLISAQKVNAKILGGLCTVIPQDFRGPYPTIYQFNENPGPGPTVVMLDYPEDSIVQCVATGTACVLIHRDVFEGMQQHAIECREWLAQNQLNDDVQFLIQHGLMIEPHPDYCWFNETVRRERWVSEDIEFCLRANALGFGVFVDTTIEVGHYKDRRTWWPSDIKKGIGFRRSPITAVVPVKDKFYLTAGIIDQLRQQTCDDIIICDNGSAKETREFLEQQEGITLLDCEGLGIHEMWNRGALHSLEKHGHRVHIAFLNNDLKLAPNCLRTLSHELTDNSRVVPGIGDFIAMSANYDNRTADSGTIVQVTDICANRYDGTGGLAGFAFMVNGTLFSNGYRFPEVCKWWFGDNDIMAYLAYSGFRAGIALNAKVEHLDGGGQTSNEIDRDEFERQIEEDRRAFENRWNQFALQLEARARQRQHQCDPEALKHIKDIDRIVETLPFICDLEESAKAFPRQWSDDVPFMVKIREDVERYQQIIEDTKPEVIIECGTWDGGSAEWFSSLGLDVITIDIEDHVSAERKAKLNGQVHWLRGSSIAEETVEEVKRLVGGRRTMVSLDSDHHGCHVAAEMALYGELVTNGCYLVVEDGLVRYVPGPEHQTILQHGPLDAIENYLPGSDFERDEVIEKMHPATMHPAGFLRKHITWAEAGS